MEAGSPGPHTEGPVPSSRPPHLACRALFCVTFTGKGPMGSSFPGTRHTGSDSTWPQLQGTPSPCPSLAALSY